VNRSRSGRSGGGGPAVIHEALSVDPQRVRNPVDVVEVPHDVDHLGDGTITESLPSKKIEIGRGGRRGVERQLLRKGAERLLSFAEQLPLLFPIGLRRQDLVVVPTLGSEVPTVGLRSVETAIGRARHRGQELLLARGELGF